MESPVILVVDSDDKNLRILQESLEAADFTVLTASTGSQAWEIALEEMPELVLSEVDVPELDGFGLLEKLKSESATSTIPLVFLTNKRALQDRVRSLRGGVKDYMIKPLHVKEVVARVRMILRRMSKVKQEEPEQSKKLVGKLEEHSVIDLIENFGVERKTGVLQIYNENNRNGEIYFSNGAVVHAALGTLRAEKAVYQMLPWRPGRFIMTFKDVNVQTSISVSNLGLLLHGFKRMELREKLFRQLPSPETTFVLTGVFRKMIEKQSFNAETAKFISLIDGRRDILQLIDESLFDDLKTLERLVKLYQQNFIIPGTASDHKTTEIKITDVGVEEQTINEVGADADDHLAISGSNQIETSHFFSSDLLSKPSEPHSQPSSIAARENGNDLEDAYNPPDADGEQDEEKTEEIPAPFSISDPFEIEEASTPAPEIKQPENELNPLERLDQKDAEDEAVFAKALFNNKAGKPAPNLPDEPDEFSIQDAQPSAGGYSDDTGQSAIFQGFDSIPEPMSDFEFRPNLDILEALAKFQDTKEFQKPIIKNIEASSDDLQPPTIIEPPLPNFVDIDEIEEPKSEQTEAPLESEPSVDRPSNLQSFPLRSYGAPGDRIQSSKPENRTTTTQPDREEPRPTKSAAQEQEPFSSAQPITSPEPPALEPLQSKIENAEEPPPFSPASFSDLDFLAQTRIEPTEERAEPTIPAQPPSPIQPTRARQPKPAAADETPAPSSDQDFLAQSKIEPTEKRAEPISTPPPSPTPATPPPLQPRRTDQPEPAASDETDVIFEKLAAEVAKPARLALIGMNKNDIQKFAGAILDEAPLKEVDSKVFSFLAMGDKSLKNGEKLSVIGVSMEQQFTKLLDNMAANLAGYVLLIDASAKDKLPYLRYLMSSLKEKYDKPCSVALIRAKGKRNFSPETFIDMLSLEASEHVEYLDLSKRRNIAGFLETMLHKSRSQPHSSAS